MDLRPIFIIALLTVSSWGLSFSPNQMQAIEFQPKKTFFEKKKMAFLAALSAVELPSLGNGFHFARQFWPTDRPVLPLPSTVSR